MTTLNIWRSPNCSYYFCVHCGNNCKCRSLNYSGVDVFILYARYACRTINNNNYIKFKWIEGSNVCICVCVRAHCSMWPSVTQCAPLSVSLCLLFLGRALENGEDSGCETRILHGSPATKPKTKSEPQSPAWGAKCSCPANEILKWAIMPP